MNIARALPSTSLPLTADSGLVVVVNRRWANRAYFLWWPLIVAFMFGYLQAGLHARQMSVELSVLYWIPQHFLRWYGEFAGTCLVHRLLRRQRPSLELQLLGGLVLGPILFFGPWFYYEDFLNPLFGVLPPKPYPWDSPANVFLLYCRKLPVLSMLWFATNVLFERGLGVRRFTYGEPAAVPSPRTVVTAPLSTDDVPAPVETFEAAPTMYAASSPAAAVISTPVMSASASVSAGPQVPSPVAAAPAPLVAAAVVNGNGHGTSNGNGHGNGNGTAAATTAGRTPPFASLLSSGDLNDVLALESEDHYLRVHTGAGSELILYRLRDALLQMPSDIGVRTHRSFWVRRTAVKEFARTGQTYSVLLTTGARLPVSRSYLNDVREALHRPDVE